MVKSIKSKIQKKRSAILNYTLRKRLENDEFSIISNNCWGGRVYQDLGITYKSPFIGLFLYAPCYIKLLMNLKSYLALELDFIDKSRYTEANKERLTNAYPLALLGDVEIHFLHYNTREEATTKWKRRTDRINWDNLFVKFCDRDLCTIDHLRSFDTLDYSNKVCFTSQNYTDIKSNVWFHSDSNGTCVENELTSYKKYFDVVGWLNSGK